MDTIFALATVRGRSGVAVCRVSGPDAFKTAQTLCGSVPKGRGLRAIRNHCGDVIDEALVLAFEEGHSFTGEPVVEYQVHGSTAVVDALLHELGRFDGLRLAEAGEFTRRALENGRLDLSQVEGLADLIDAETEAQRAQALRVFSGALGDKVEAWRRDLIHAAALLEATIDFVDEDVPVDVMPEVFERLGRTKASVESELNGVGIAERIREGFEVAIVGAPNAGKSTLLNALAGREAAITSEIAGTTRDVIEVRMDLGGLPVTILDTAGLRESLDPVEAIGIDRALKRAGAADLRVFLTEGELETFGLEPGGDDIVVRGKADLGGEGFGVSGLTGEGLEELVGRIQVVLERKASRVGSAVRARHARAMERAMISLTRCLAEAELGMGRAEVVAEELRDAIRALDSLVGRVDVENLLDEIFSSFCVGK